MKNWFGNKHKDALDVAIATTLTEMAQYEPEAREYKDALDALERLTKMRDNPRLRVSPDALVTAAASLLGIMIIVAYEQKNVMTSKAFGFTIRNHNSGTT